MKMKQNYLIDSEFKNMKFNEISIIGTDLGEDFIKNCKIEIRNLTTGEKLLIKADENLKLVNYTELNKTLVLQNLENFNLFVHQDFEINMV